MARREPEPHSAAVDLIKGRFSSPNPDREE